jgi:hypothetical protein
MIVVAASAACGPSDRTPATTGGSAGTTSSPGGSSGTGGSSGRGGSGAGVGGAAGLSGAGGKSGNAAITNVTDFNQAQWAAFCRGLFRCTIEAEEVPGIRAALGTEERCQEVFASSMPMNFGLPNLIHAVEDGRVVFAPDHVDDCLDATARCDHLVNPQPADVACRRVFQGTRNTGEACVRNEECADGGRCIIGDACPGICGPRVPTGGACDADADCDDTNGPVDCDSETSTCKTTLVLPPVGEGEPCWFGSKASVDWQPCADGLWCAGDEVVDSELRHGTCRRTRIPVGNDCDFEEDVCEEGAACWDGVCQMLIIRREPGASCAEATFCDPFQRLECVEGTCESFGDGREGSPCRFHDASAHAACEPGFACIITGSEDPVTSQTARTCLPPLAAGVPCRHAHECLSRTCGADGLCAASFCGNSAARY